MALTQRNQDEYQLHEPRGTHSSSGTSTTAAERNSACQQDDTVTKHATILDIDPNARIPRDGMTFRKPTIDDLLRRGSSEIMSRIDGHQAPLRWIHLRSNCMSWIQDLMEKVCEERNIHMPENASKRVSTPTKVNPILRKDLFYNLFHGKASQHIQTRFMGPTCTPFSIDMDDEQSDSPGESTRGSRDNLVLYLPYLNWESSRSWEERQQLMHDIAEGQPREDSVDSELIRDYLHHEYPLHDRRTLHQAYYHDFGMTRSLPVYHQVMEGFTAKLTPEKEAKLLVVDQLWLWIIRGRGSTTTEDCENKLNPDLVITAFPGRFNGLYDSADIYHGIIEHLECGLEPPLRNANDLASVIVEHCTGVFFQRQLESDKWFLEFFAAAIGTVRDNLKSAFVDFRTKSEELDELIAKKASLVEVAQRLENVAFSIRIETSLFSEIKDIIDELDCIDYVLSRQENVIGSLTRTQRLRSFKTVCEIVKERRGSWAGIAQTAKLTCAEIEAQMDLKQKQSSLAETRIGRFQVEDSARHGRIMLLFTVVTIIFLPMSFLATWFGMNLKGSGNSGQLELGVIAAVIFPISIMIAVVALAFAISQRLRDSLAAWAEGIIEGALDKLGIRESRSADRMRSDRGRDRGLRRFDVRLRRFAGTEPEDEIVSMRDNSDEMA